MSRNSNSLLKLAVIIVCYNEKHYLDECMGSLLKQSYNGFDIFLVDNNSTDGSVDFVKKKYKSVKIIRNRENLGFAAANNIAMRKIFRTGYDLCFLTNPDTKSDKDLIKNLIKTYRKKSLVGKIGVVQPLILLYDNKELINSYGNPIHFLGFGYAGGYMQNKKVVNTDKRIISAAGASLITKDFFEDTGGFDETFFMYCEDQNMCWRGLLLGYKYYLSHKAVFYHKYKFNKNKKKLFFFERNRLMMLFENYSIKTIILLLPIFVVNELLMIIYSLFNGWFRLKILSYFSFIKNFRAVIINRKDIQTRRVVSDKTIFRQMICELNFGVITNSLFVPLNFLYRVYFNLVKLFV